MANWLMTLLIGSYPPQRRTFARFTVIVSLRNAPLTVSSVLECVMAKVSKAALHSFAERVPRLVARTWNERKSVCHNSSLRCSMGHVELDGGLLWCRRA